MGLEIFGIINFAAAYVVFYEIIIDYGFGLSATQLTAKERHDNKQLSFIFWNVIYTKVFLFINCTLIFVLSVLIFPKFSSNLIIYLFSFLSLIGAVLFPEWFFKGVENMKLIFTITLLVKIVWMIFIFIEIKTQADVLN